MAAYGRICGHDAYSKQRLSNTEVNRELNITQLKCFWEIVNTGNFSNASENLYISQSAVSKNILALERAGVAPFLQEGKASSARIHERAFSDRTCIGVFLTGICVKGVFWISSRGLNLRGSTPDCLAMTSASHSPLIR